jgi:hypothetical protein
MAAEYIDLEKFKKRGETDADFSFQRKSSQKRKYINNYKIDSGGSPLEGCGNHRGAAP